MALMTKTGKEAFRQQKLAKTRGRRNSLAAERRIAEIGATPRRNDLLPDVQVRKVPVCELKPSPHRSRRTSLDQLERVIASIADLGFNNPILTTGREIIDGHIRVEAATRLGLAEVPAIDCAHLSPTDVRKLRLALNRIAELGEWDLELLKSEFVELIALEVDLDATGFTQQEQDIILLDTEAAEDEDLEEEPPELPVTRLGDVWQMGVHRVICGSALDLDVYERLLEGVSIAAIVADFPYNVRIAGNVSGLGKKKHREFQMASGEMSRDEFARFLEVAIACSVQHLVDGGVLFGFMDWRSIDLLYGAGSASSLTLLNLIVWFKESGGMGGFYRSAHELIAVLCKGDVPRTNNIQLGKHGRDRTNVWCVAGANRRGSSANEMLGEHATPKPVELCADAILDVTQRDEAVLDPFVGSPGTELEFAL